MAAARQEKTVVVLQGGGALGSYQAGAYEGLAAAHLDPDWVAGISIGAINAAIIAGNPTQRRVKRLRTFWDLVSSRLTAEPLAEDSASRRLFNELSALMVAASGVPGFFDPRFPPPLLQQPGSVEATSFYDTAPLRATLEELVDFDLLNSGRTRLSLGAVNVRTGNFAYFDSTKQTITPEHVMASGALPPGLPFVNVGGEYYWDGGLVSNTPLQYVLDGAGPREDMCVFQIDLFSAQGTIPKTLLDVAQREKEIRYSSRTRLNTDVFRTMQTLRRAVRRLDRLVPPDIKETKEWKLLDEWSCDAAITIVHLIHRRAAYDTHTKDYEFSRYTVNENWRMGREDIEYTLNHPDWKNRVRPSEGVRVLDCTRERATKSAEHS